MMDYASDPSNPKFGTRCLTMHANLGKKVVVKSDLGPAQSKLSFSIQAAAGMRAEDLPGSRSIPRGVIIFTDRMVCADETPDIPGLVPDWRPIDEPEYETPTSPFQTLNKR